MKKLLFFLVLPFVFHASVHGEELEDNYAYVLAGILNEITPELGEKQALNMLVPCSRALKKVLEKHSIGGGIDDERNDKVVSTLVFNYGREGKNIVHWDSTMAEFMEKEVSLEEIKRLDSVIRDKDIRQAIIKSEKITNRVISEDMKERIVSWAKSWAVSSLTGKTPAKVKEESVPKTFKKEFEVFYKESGIEKYITEVFKKDAKYKGNKLYKYLEKNMYSMALNIAIHEISEDELRLVNEQYQQGILVRYMYVTRNLQRDTVLFEEAYQSFLRKFAKWVETQDEFRQLTGKVQTGKM